MSAGAAVNRRAVHCFIRIRAQGYYSNGVWRGTTPEESFCKGNVQPASQADIERLPQGARADGAVTVFTTADLVTTEGGQNEIADKIRHDGTLYEVSRVTHWPDFNRAVCAKVGQ